jgi:tripartite-type tricarboxylate transporter receptor subunit TctC
MPPIRIAALLLAATLTASAVAQTYPSRPITLIVPSTPGGSVDQLAREIGRKLQERLGQPVIVDNRGGAGGIIGTEAVARAKPDGYTLLVGTIAGLATNVSLEKIRYDPLRDFAPITLVGLQDFVLCVNPEFAVSSVSDLVAMAKAKPRTITYASAGKGTGSHLSGELLGQLAGVELIHVPYRGVSPATMDVIGGQVNMSFASVATALPQLKVKKLKAIAVTGPKRSPMLPDLPTVAEAGIKGYESSTWYAIVAPAATPPDVVDRLYKEIASILKEPELQRKFTQEGIDIVASTPPELKAFMQKEIEKWRKVVKTAGIASNQ